MRLAVVGGAGEVGAMILPALTAAHEVTVVDVVRPAAYTGPFVSADVTDPDALATAFAGQQTLVYLAMGSKREWGSAPWAASQFDINVKGLYLTVRAAAEAGVGKVVYASTASVWRDYLHVDHPADPQPDAVDAYGLSKRLGEQVCAAACVEHGLDVVALRLTGPMPDDQWRTFRDGPNWPVMTAASDIARAFLAALDLSRPGFSAFLITGDDERRLLDWSATSVGLGWAPQARRDPEPAVDH